MMNPWDRMQFVCASRRMSYLEVKHVQSDAWDSAERPAGYE